MVILGWKSTFPDSQVATIEINGPHGLKGQGPKIFVLTSETIIFAFEVILGPARIGKYFFR